MNQKFSTNSKEEENALNEINTIIDNIKNEIYFSDDEIENNLKSQLSKLDKQKSIEIIKQLHKQFPEEQFIKRPYFQEINIEDVQKVPDDIKQCTSTPDAYKQKYKDNYQKKMFNEILQDIKNEKYCQANQIPFEIKDYFIPLSKIGKDLNLIFDLINLMQDKAKFEYLSVLKLLINLFFLECHNNDIKVQIHQLVGTLLENQIYKFEYYVVQIINKNQQEFQHFKQFIEKVQFQEISAQQGQDELVKCCKDKSILLLFEQFTIKLGDHARNLLDFIKDLIYTSDQEVNKDDLIQYISLTENFDQNVDFLYFKFVFYFWIQFIVKLQINESIQQIETKLTKSQKKQLVLENGIAHLKSKQNNKIYIYLLNKIIYYNKMEDNAFIQIYKEQELFEEQNINQLKILREQDIQSLIQKKLNESKTISNKLMFYQFQNQLQNQNSSIHFFKFLATNSSFDNIQIIEKLLKDIVLTENQLAQLSQQQQINLLHLQQAIKNNTQLKMKRYVNQKEIFSKYPKQLMIQMDEFNISLTSQLETESTILEWLKDRKNQINFKKLLPYYFNIIKRGESPEVFLALINKNIIKTNENNRNETLNLKSLFQLLYNNSDKELQVMLLKMHSRNYPVPLLYQNPLLSEKINSILDLYVFNSNIFYLLSNDFTIINCSLSKKVNQFGKSELINMLFYNDYKDQKFEVSDSSFINNYSIDCQFDFSFNGSRNYLIADVHGQLEDEIYETLLPFFKLWIIQLQSENQLEENLDKVIDLRKKMNQQFTPNIIIIIRDSDKKQFNQDKINILKQQSVNIQTYQIPNLQKLENKAILLDERAKIKDIIIQMINNQNKLVNEEELKNQFLNICKSLKQEQDINQNSETILKDLSNELDKMIKEQDGFYSIKAFPLRHLKWKMQSYKKQKQELNYTTNQYEQELEKKQNAIQIMKIYKNSNYEDQIKQKEKEKEQIQNQIKQAQQQLQDIRKKISEIEEINKSQSFKESTLITLFNNIFNQDNFYIIYLRFVELIAKFNKRNLKLLTNQIEEVKLQLGSKKDELQQERAKLEQNLKQLENQMIVQNVSIELFWREIIKGNKFFQNDPINVVCKLIKKGEPFEFLNGDDLSIDSNFFHELRNQLLNNENNKILFLSILGPQSSGKSTLLNRIFGCHFLTSIGRCTKGLYLQLLKISNKEQFGGLFDYILLLDSEGLQNPNQQDPEFDKKISLFIISISDILIFNVKGEIHSTFHNLIEVSFYTLAQFSKLKFLKQFAWCFNQNIQINDEEKYKLLMQIQDIGDKLNSEKNIVYEEGNKIDYTKYLDITKDNIYILGTATNSQEWQPYHSNSQSQKQSQIQEMKQEINQQEYSKNALSFGVSIIQKYIIKYKQAKQDHNEILTWNAFVTKVEQYWDIVSKLPDLVEFSDLKEQKDYEIINKSAKSKMAKANDKNKILDNLIVKIQKTSKTYNSLKDFDVLQNEVKQNFLRQNDNQKDEILKELQNECSYQIISDAIRKKVEGNITEAYQAISLEGSLIILQKIHQLRRQFQYNLVPAKIQQTVTEILNDLKYLEYLQQNQDKRNDEFDKLWDQLVQTSNDEIENLHREFQIKLFDCFLKYQKQFYCKQDDLQDQIEYFAKDINKQDPNANKQKEILKICQLFNKDIKQDFVYNLNKQSKKEFQLIFDEDIFKRLDNMPKNRIINPLDYLEEKITYQVLEKKEIVNQIKQNFKQQLITIVNEAKSEKQRKDDIQELFTILKQLPIEFDKQMLSDILNSVNSSFDQFKKHLQQNKILYNFQYTQPYQPSPQSQVKNKFIPKGQNPLPISTHDLQMQQPQIYSTNGLQRRYPQIDSTNGLQRQQLQIQQLLINSIELQRQQPIIKSTNWLQIQIPPIQEKKIISIDNLINSIKVQQSPSEPKIKLRSNYIFKKFPYLQEFKELQGINIQELNNFFVFNEQKVINYKQSQNSKYESFFNYIINQKTDKIYQKDYYKSFPNLFLEIMNENKGWIKLFSEIYDIIKQQFDESLQSKENQTSDISNVFQIIQMNEDMTQYNRQLIQKIITKVENILEATNKQLAFFGVEFGPVLIRKLNFFSFFIIWRFICYDQLKMYQQEQKTFIQKKTIMKRKFEYGVMKQELEEIKQQAQEQANYLYQLCVIQFYQDYKNEARNIINSNQKTSYELIKELDQLLLIDKVENIILGQQKENSITEYLTDQKGFIKKYVEQSIKNLQNKIENQFEVQNYVQDCRKKIINNASTLLDRVLKLSNSKDFKMQDCFYNYQNETLSLHSILLFIAGKIVQTIENFKYPQIFILDNNIQQIELSIDQTSNKDNISLFFLKPFLIEFISQIQILSNENKKLKTSIDEFQLKGLIQEIKNNMNGCDHSCPMCHRKCDYEDYQEKDHKHKCTNGHQLRGMNKILIKSSPSLFTCEEIDDKAEIQIKENRKFITWREIKQIYNTWNFKDILSTQQQVQENKQKMIEIWNGGIGQYICQQLSKELDQEIIYQKKHDLPMHLQHSSTHYIFILDDSASMTNHWTSVIKCVEQQFQQISKKENVKASVVIFNKDARIVVNCEKVKIEEQLKLLVFQNGSDTNFGPAFKLTLELIEQNSEFNNSVILFYTDGIAGYPKQEIEQFGKLSKSLKDSIYFLACSSPEKSASLELIVNFCQKEFTYAEWRDKIEPSNININWTEMISNAHLEKYKA